MITIGNKKKMTNIQYSDNNKIMCIACKKVTTPWQDGICSSCSYKVPKHITYSQHKKYYLLKMEKGKRKRK